MEGGGWPDEGGKKGKEREGRGTLGEIRTSETSDSRCSFQKVHKNIYCRRFLFMKKFREIFSRETGVVLKVSCILMLPPHHCVLLFKFKHNISQQKSF